MKRGEQQAKALARMLRLDLRRGICSGRFLLGVGMAFAWMLGNSLRELNNAYVMGGPYLYSMALDGTLYLGPVILSIATIPYAGEYLTERQCGFHCHAIKRTDVKTYGVSKVLATVLSAFLMVLAAIGLYLLWMTCMGLSHTFLETFSAGTYLGWANTLGAFWYYAAMALRMGLVCGVSAVFALMVSAYIPNAYVIFFSPMIAYYLSERIVVTLDGIIPVPKFLVPLGLCFAQIGSDPGVSLFVTLLVLTAVIFLCGRRFLKKLRKEPV